MDLRKAASIHTQAISPQSGRIAASSVIRLSFDACLSILIDFTVCAPLPQDRFVRRGKAGQILFTICGEVHMYVHMIYGSHMS